MLQFNMLLKQAGIDPVDVRLLRHQPRVGGRSLLDIWRSDAATFGAYQSIQLVSARTSFARPYWASFIGTWDGRTVFVGLYRTNSREEMPNGGTDPITDRQYEPGTTDLYHLTPAEPLADYRGRLYVEWGGGSSGKRAWNQRADVQSKAITELHLDVTEQPFPGLLAVNMPLSHYASIPPTWIEHLSAARGIYLLSCPRDGSRYVGSTDALGGFWARWSNYLANGHGGNLGMAAREPSDYFATILEVAGSSASLNDIVAAEVRWKEKLRTREWGLNLN